MPKWSEFVRALGPAGPPTVQGLYALGFALRSEIPALFAKYLRVDATQTFSTPEKLTGRQNLGLGNVDNTSDASKPISTATQTALDLKAPLANPAFTGNPTAATQAVGDRSTRLATTAFVGGELAGLLTIADLANAASKTTPVDADSLPLTDSAASNGLKKLTWANLKTAVRSFLLGIASTWTAKQTFQSAGFTTAAVDLAVGQISFPASQNSSANARTLDDYQEGTFNPNRSGFTETGGGNVNPDRNIHQNRTIGCRER